MGLGWLGDVTDELYDMAVLPNIKQPAAIGFKSNAIRRAITIGEDETV